VRFLVLEIGQFQDTQTYINTADIIVNGRAGTYTSREEREIFPLSKVSISTLGSTHTPLQRVQWTLFPGYTGRFVRLTAHPILAISLLIQTHLRCAQEQTYCLILPRNDYKPIPLAERAKAYACSRWLAGIVRPNLGGGMDGWMSVVSVVCCQVEVFVMGSPTESAYVYPLQAQRVRRLRSHQEEERGMITA